MSNQTATTIEVKRLAQAYAQRPEIEQKIMQVMAVIYDCSSRQKIVDCLNEIGMRTSKNLKFDSAKLRPYIVNLLKIGLLIEGASRAAQCNPLIAEIVTLDLIKKGKKKKIFTAIQKLFPFKFSEKNARYFYQFRFEQFLREARFYFYQEDLEQLEVCIENHNIFIRKNYSSDRATSLSEIMSIISLHILDKTDVAAMLPQIYETILVSNILENAPSLESSGADLGALLAHEESSGHPLQDSTKLILARLYLLRGESVAAESLIQDISAYPAQKLALSGWLAVITGEFDRAIDLYAEGLQLLRKAKSKRKNVYFDHLEGVFFIWALLRRGSPNDLQLALTICEFTKQTDYTFSAIYNVLWHLVKVRQGELTSQVFFKKYEINQTYSDLEKILLIFGYFYGDRQAFLQQTKLTQTLVNIYTKASKHGYGWVAMAAADFLVVIYAEKNQKLATSYQQKTVVLQQNNLVSLTQMLHHKEAWELSLNALINFRNPATATPINIAEKRLIWLLNLSHGWFDLEIKEQKLKANGDWSKGRAIALRRIENELHSFDYFTPQDRRICTHLEISRNYSYYGNEVSYEWSSTALADLINHPLVFWADQPGIRVEILKGEIQLRVQELSDTQLAISLDPPLPPVSEALGLITIRETPTRLRVYEVTPEHQKITNIIGIENKLTAPTSAKDQVLAAINGIGEVLTIHSDIGGGDIQARETVTQSTPHIHLFPTPTGLKATILVCPFGEKGPYYHPGKGGELVVAEVEGERLKTHRDLEQEAGNAFDVLTECAVLLDAPKEAGELFIEDPESCLELIAQLRNLGDRVIVEWPQGEKFSITHYGSGSNFHGQIRQERDWFALEGELRLGDDLVLDMQHLFQLLEKTPGRFIQLDDGKFLALTNEFRRRLDDLRVFADQRGQTTRIHPLAAFALGDFTDEMQVDADHHWQSHIRKLSSGDDVLPSVPSTLQAELRDYQIEGFQWLMRLAQWQMGACLADDMGLGKTLQALAVIVSRAPQGASLVIAPTSVCLNWLAEVAKFAPTLKPIQFGSGDRQETLENLQPFDLLICSYGLLQQETVAAMLSTVSWQTIVLDEAQAIKNSATKRSQSAMQLQGEFKIITTGTPIENHLGELWNLFRFINPGLLGSQKSFNERFANAIERNQDLVTKQRLKRLIQPFILRRTKTQVLTELPSRTEITLFVDLSTEEMAMYEALRREAIAKLADSNSEAGAKHLQVLAEIMKLRRMCCNPRLLMPDTHLSGSKLDLFGETLSELLENHHKALVFSQFVDHLTILRNYLDAQKISYQYLDGSTPIKKRQQAVDSFQAGDGDVFLISLKAGGTGLNLTAADYVIHMDPWWNPAVEDQASDRAHRMGQQRPVTIYRLVARNTIEEKIVALHHHKRDLASSLLEGTDSGGRMSTNELLNLIREV